MHTLEDVMKWVEKAEARITCLESIITGLELEIGKEQVKRLMHDSSGDFKPLFPDGEPPAIQGITGQEGRPGVSCTGYQATDEDLPPEM